MQLKKWALPLAPIFFLLSGFTQVRVDHYNVVQGVVVDRLTGKPVNEAHVFIVEGEEEALTNAKGEFTIKTWQKLPLKLTVINYKSLEQAKVSITDPGKKQMIRLKSSQ